MRSTLALSVDRLLACFGPLAEVGAGVGTAAVGGGRSGGGGGGMLLLEPPGLTPASCCRRELGGLLHKLFALPLLVFFPLSPALLATSFDIFIKAILLFMVLGCRPYFLAMSRPDTGGSLWRYSSKAASTSSREAILPGLGMGNVRLCRSGLVVIIGLANAAGVSTLELSMVSSSFSRASVASFSFFVLFSLHSLIVRLPTETPYRLA